MRLESFSLSDVGLVRQENEDSKGCFPQWNLYLVADGMGGHAGGKQASQLAVSIIEDRFPGPSAGDPTGSSDRLIDGVRAANREIFDRARAGPTLQGMGTTLVALLFETDVTAIIVHVGDSRAYRARGGRVEQLTGDHSLVADLLREKKISEAEVDRHLYRHVLTRALGVAEEVSPDITRTDVRPGDLYLLCSDGVHGIVPPEELRSILLGENVGLEEMCRRLVAAALAGGGKDNATVIAVQCLAD